MLSHQGARPVSGDYGVFPAEEESPCCCQSKMWIEKENSSKVGEFYLLMERQAIRRENSWNWPEICFCFYVLWRPLSLGNKREKRACQFHMLTWVLRVLPHKGKWKREERRRGNNCECKKSKIRDDQILTIKRKESFTTNIIIHSLQVVIHPLASPLVGKWEMGQPQKVQKYVLFLLLEEREKSNSNWEFCYINREKISDSRTLSIWKQ